MSWWRILPLVTTCVFVAVVQILDAGATGTINVGAESSIVLGAQGYPVVAYYDQPNGNLKLLHCNDVNCAGGDDSIATVDSTGDTGRQPSLQLDATGNPVVAYGGNNSLKLVHCNDPNCVGNNESITTPDASISGGFNSLELDATGNPVISYCGVAGDCETLKVMHCNDANCAGNNEMLASFPLEGGQYASLELNSSGNPVVAYCRDGVLCECPGDTCDLKLLVCGNPTCTSGNTIVALDTANSGRATSLVLDAFDKPVVSFRMNSQLRVLRCGDPTCSSGNATFTTPAIDPAVRTWIVLDAVGNPVIASDRSAQNDVVLLRCNDALCAGNNESLQVLESIGAAPGGEPSLVLDGAGNPVVSYTAQASLIILHCNDANCAPGGDSRTAPEVFKVLPTPTPTPSPTPHPVGGLGMDPSQGSGETSVPPTAFLVGGVLAVLGAAIALRQSRAR
jgi:hypothetical protein